MTKICEKNNKKVIKKGKKLKREFLVGEKELNQN